MLCVIVFLPWVLNLSGNIRVSGSFICGKKSTGKSYDRDKAKEVVGFYRKT